MLFKALLDRHEQGEFSQIETAEMRLSLEIPAIAGAPPLRAR